MYPVTFTPIPVHVVTFASTYNYNDEEGDNGESASLQIVTIAASQIHNYMYITV